MARYQVVAEMAAHVEVQELGGRSVQTFYQGHYLPDGVPAERIKDLLGKGVIAEEGVEPLAPNASVDQDPARGLESVTTEVLQGEKPEKPRQDPTLEAAEKVAEVVTEEGRIDKAAENPRQASTDGELEQKRAAARAKLPADGSEPDGRAGQAVWVEFMVSKGSNYDDVKDATKADLQRLHEQQSK
jgi:hypothetical protein